ncbi:unnamed protein product [Prunus armeniaca]
MVLHDDSLCDEKFVHRAKSFVYISGFCHCRYRMQIFLEFLEPLFVPAAASARNSIRSLAQCVVMYEVN